jgi:hypothetical protein
MITMWFVIYTVINTMINNRPFAALGAFSSGATIVLTFAGN